ncbi:MAG: Spy/CpxP family protein refolding chaperone, partial [Pseudolabrys sp.]
MAGALAMPASAAPPPRAAGGHPAAHVGGGAPHFGGARPAFHAPAARSFAPHVGARSFTPHFSRRSFTPHVNGRSFTSHVGGRSFASHVGRRSFTPHVNRRSANFANTHRGTTFNRSVLRSQRLTHRNIVNRNALNNSRARRSNANANLRNRAFHRNATGSVTHRNAAGSVTPLAARRGRFASRFASNDPAARSAFAARRAWRHHRRAGFVAWYGPVFWPYAYSDIFDYTFWPDGYDDGYWAYAYDYFFDGIFWGGYGPSAGDEYAYAPSSRSAAPRVRRAAVEQLCNEPGTGITAWPFADIERKVGLNGEQKQLLGDLRAAAREATAAFKVSCPSAGSYPLTPPGRLAAMTARLTA